MIVYTEKVQKDDLLMFINACYTCTGQDEFYENEFSQNVSISFFHEYMLVNYRNLYAKFLQTGINHFNMILIIKNLLKTGKNIDKIQRRKEIEIIKKAFDILPPQRVYKIFTSLSEEKINNRSVRYLIKDYILNKRDMYFDAIKYKTKFKASVRHIHLKLSEELNTFLYGDYLKSKGFKNELLEAYRKSHYAREYLYELPFTIAEGLAQKFNIKKETFINNIQDKLTHNERLRLQNSIKDLKNTKIEINPNKLSLTNLTLYILSLPFEERIRDSEKLEEYLKNSIKSIKMFNLNYKKVVAILDRSFSSSGSQEKQRRPLGVALASYYFLKENVKEFYPLWTLEPKNVLSVYPKGATNIAERLIEALEINPDIIFIFSDGFENSPSGAVDEVMRVYEKLKIKTIPIIHFNPVFNSESYEPKKLSERIITLGIRNAEDIPALTEFASFAQGKTSLKELEVFFEAKT